NQDCNFLLTPLSTSDSGQSQNRVSLNYTNQDFDSLKSRLVSYVKENFPNDFSDFIESSLAIMLIEIWAFVGDTLSFKMDQIANEVFIDTVSEVENAFRLSKLVGFTPTPPIAAKAMFSAKLSNVLPTDLVIPSALHFDLSVGGQAISYELFAADANNNAILDQDIIIPTGSLSNISIVGLEGTTITDNFTATGDINQSITLNNSPILFDSIR